MIYGLYREIRTSVFITKTFLKKEKKMNRRFGCVKYSFCIALYIIIFIFIKFSLRIDHHILNLNERFQPSRSHRDLYNVLNRVQYKTERNKRENILAKFLEHTNDTKQPTEMILAKRLENKEHFNSSNEVQRRIVVNITWEQFQKSPNSYSGNPLIDNYGKNDPSKMGENGSGVLLAGQDKANAAVLLDKYYVNVYLSDKIPLNRMVPDARFPGCAAIAYPEELPVASVIIPFYDEWPSILLRTIYSIINRTPRKLLKEIILVDDCSQMEDLKDNLDNYIHTHFPKGLVKLIRQPERFGIVKARLEGFKHSTGDVIVILDSHMEVNIDWLQPLLTEIKKDRKTIALANLNYIQRDTLEYDYLLGYINRYGFDWRLVFFEIYFRDDQIGDSSEEARPAAVMVGSGFAVDRSYFEEIGTYDEDMYIWGGENLELSWRIWLCGGRLLHVPCSHIGHIARGQPYSFPEGRDSVVLTNYKRAIEVWMEPEHKQLVYNHFPDMKYLDLGNLSMRLKIKDRLQCKPFSWYLENVWPELYTLSTNVSTWGFVQNRHMKVCLDTNNNVFPYLQPLFVEPCNNKYTSQGFSLTNKKLLRASLQCVVVKENVEDTKPELEDCITGSRDTWVYKHEGYIEHEKTGLCLDLDKQGPIMKTCNSEIKTQFWQFITFVE